MKKQNQDPVLERPSVKEDVAIPKIESTSDFQYKETRELVRLVQDAADLLAKKGETAFTDFRLQDSRWRHQDHYIFVLDMEGNMIVHPDAELEGKNQLELKDINGKFIIQGLLNAATRFPDKPEGWFHYQWNIPGEYVPSWKSSFVKSVKTASGKSYVLGSGMYNDRMEKVFIVDMVNNAVKEVEKLGMAAFDQFRDPSGPYMVKDSYIFVIDMNGIEMVNPAFPTLEGRNLLDFKDTQGKYFHREMINLVKTSGAGWCDYMWPKPGESVSTRKSAFVSKAKLGDQFVIVGCGVYLAGSPRSKPLNRISAPQVMSLVREAAGILQEKGEKAFADFRVKDSKWFREGIYFFVFDPDGTRIFHATEPETEGRKDINLKDIHGRPIVQMILDTAGDQMHEGWVHYMYAEPGSIFPAWKSSFVKQVRFPSGADFIIGCGIYNMQMDEAFIEDLVNRAGQLIEKRGMDAFDQFRNKTGPFFFMDTYVFVQTPEGIELVNPAQPSLEGRNLTGMKDLNGKEMVREEIAAVMTKGTAWVNMYWYKPGDNRPALKKVYLKKVQFENEIYIVGSGFYPEAFIPKGGLQKFTWKDIETEKMSGKLDRQTMHGEFGTLAQFFVNKDGSVQRHFHPSEEYLCMLSGALKFTFDDREIMVKEGEVLIIPSNEPHSIVAVEDSKFVEFFAPVREDWIRGEDQYLR